MVWTRFGDNDNVDMAGHCGGDHSMAESKYFNQSMFIWPREASVCDLNLVCIPPPATYSSVYADT